MADVIVTGFEGKALELLERYLGKTKGSVSNSIRDARGAVSNDEVDNYQQKIEDAKQQVEELIQKETNLKYIRDLSNKELSRLQDMFAKIGKSYDELTTNEKRQYTILKNKIEAEITYQGKLDEQIKSIKTENALIQEQISNWNNVGRQMSENIAKAQTYSDILSKIKHDKDAIYEKERNSYYAARVKFAKENPEDYQKFRKKEHNIAKQKGVTREWLERHSTVSKLFGGDINEFANAGKKHSIVKGIASNLLTMAGNAASFIMSDKQASISDVGGKMANVAGMFGPWGKAAGVLVQGLTAAVEMADRINKSASDYARSVGGGVAKMKQMRTQATSVASAISQWGGKAYKFDKILEHTAELSKETGRVMEHMSNMDFKSLEDLRQWGIDSSVLNQFDTFGLSMETIDKRIKSIYSNSGKHGLNAKAVTDAVTKNLKMAQNYTFAGGLRALERMAEKSVSLKYNMESVSRFADKVSTLEGAATTGAQLSVLGGDFARMGNPLSLLYGGLQDAERLNDMMLNMTKNMAQWDSQKGQMEISAYNRQRLRAAAESIGVDYNDLINQAMTQGKRNRIDNQLDMSGKINNDDTREYIKNIAQFDEEGRGYVVFHEGDTERRVDVDKLTENDKEKLAEESKRYEDEQNAKLGDVLSQTRTITEKLNDLIDVLRAKIAKGIISIYNWLDRWKGGGKNQIDMDTFLMTSSQENDYKALQSIRNNGGFAGVSVEQKERLNSLYGIKDASQLIGKSNSELSEMITGKVQTKASGGIIRGKGTSMSDSIPAMLSNGEFVMNAKATSKHLPTLQAWNADGYNSGTIIPIKAGNNQTNPLSVKENISNIRSSSESIQKMSIEPISINISGTISLTGNGFTKDIDADKLLSDNIFVSKLIREIEKATNYALDKNKVHMKYPM